MELIDPFFEVVYCPDYEDVLSVIEKAGRTCYKSEERIKEGSAEPFIDRVVNNFGHASVAEHMGFSLRIVCDRAVTHELVRHRLCAYSQESQRYVDMFGDDIQFIRPYWMIEGKRPQEAEELFLGQLADAEHAYKQLRAMGVPPQEARGVLPNATKTEIVVTTNFREWRHILTLRHSAAAHPDMRYIMGLILDFCKEKYPVLFKDIK